MGQKEETVQVRLSKDDYEKLTFLAEQLGTNRPSVLRILLKKCTRIDAVVEEKLCQK